MQELSFLSAEFDMCFGIAPSACRSVHEAPIFRSFEPSPWHGNGCLRNTQLLGKHFLRLCIVLIQKSLQLTVLNLPGLIFTLLVTQVKIVVIEPTKSLTLFPIKHCRHRPPQAFNAFRQLISSN